MRKKVPASSTDLVAVQENAIAAKTPGGPLPALVTESGRPGATAWDDFFDGKLGKNTHTRLAYERAVRYFLTWAQDHVPDKSLAQISASDVGRYLRHARRHSEEETAPRRPAKIFQPPGGTTHHDY